MNIKIIFKINQKIFGITIEFGDCSDELSVVTTWIRNLNFTAKTPRHKEKCYAFYILFSFEPIFTKTCIF